MTFKSEENKEKVSSQKELPTIIEPFDNVHSDLEDDDEVLGDLPALANYDKTRLRADST